jgi:hypothetical protein
MKLLSRLLNNPHNELARQINYFSSGVPYSQHQHRSIIIVSSDLQIDTCTNLR